MSAYAYRLVMTDPNSWALFPIYEKRVRAFLKEFSPEMDDQQLETYLADVRTRFVTVPHLTGYLLMMEAGDSPINQKISGHVLAFVQEAYGKPYVMLMQAKMDEGTGKDLLMQAMAMCREWVSSLNEQLRANHARQGLKTPLRLIDFVEHWTVHPADEWKRLMPDLDYLKQWTVMRIRV